MTAATLLGNVGFIGAGALGSTLAQAMHRRGYAVRAVASRTPASAERLAAAIPGCEPASPQAVADRCDTVFLTVPDDAIADVAASLRWREGQAVVHCSGALPLSVLGPASDAGALTGAMHPMQTFTAGVDPVTIFKGVACAIEAPDPLREALEQLAINLGGPPSRWPPGTAPSTTPAASPPAASSPRSCTRRAASGAPSPASRTRACAPSSP